MARTPLVDRLIHPFRVARQSATTGAAEVLADLRVKGLEK